MFEKVLDIEENVNAGLNRSVFVTYYHQDAVRRALTASFFLFFIFLIYLFFFYFPRSMLYP